MTMDAKEVRNLQEKLGYTDQQMAATLGCSRGHWNKVKKGRRPVSVKVAQQLEGITYPQETISNTTETAQDNNLDGLWEWVIAIIVWFRNQIRTGR